VYAPRPLPWILFSYALLILIGYTSPQNHTRPSNIILLFLFIISYVPITTLFALNAASSIVPLISVTLVFIAINFLVQYDSLIKFSAGTSEVKPEIFFFFLFVFSIISYTILIYSFGFSAEIPTFDEIRELRETYREEQSRLVIYLFQWQSTVINPLLFILGLYFRNVWLIIISVTGQLYLYSVGGHKAIFFINFLVLFVFIGLKYFKTNFNNFILISIISLVALLLCVDYFSNDYSLLSSILVRRMFMVPAQFFYYYYDFFSSHPVDYYAQNFPFSLFLTSHYQFEIPYVISDFYVNKLNSHANANIFADSYANLGPAGFFIVGLLLLMILKYLDAVSSNKNMFIVLPLLCFSVINIANSSLITTMITHGLLLTLVIMTILPKFKTKASL
jgi:O-antigen polymerase